VSELRTQKSKDQGRQGLSKPCPGYFAHLLVTEPVGMQQQDVLVIKADEDKQELDGLKTSRSLLTE
jgi:hypothetical protein